MSSFKDMRIVDNFYQTSAFFPYADDFDLDPNRGGRNVDRFIFALFSVLCCR